MRVKLEVNGDEDWIAGVLLNSSFVLTTGTWLEQNLLQGFPANGLRMSVIAGESNQFKSCEDTRQESRVCYATLHTYLKGHS